MKTSSAFSFAQADIDHVLRLGGNADRFRERIVAEFEKQKPIPEIAAYLQTIYDRATSSGRWLRVTLWFDERDALNNFLELHTFQMNQLGRAEFLAAIDAAQKHTLNQGHTVTLARNLERLAA